MKRTKSIEAARGKRGNVEVKGNSITLRGPLAKFIREEHAEKPIVSDEELRVALVDYWRNPFLWDTEKLEIELPIHMAQWVKKQAKAQWGNTISDVVREAVEGLHYQETCGHWNTKPGADEDSDED